MNLMVVIAQRTAFAITLGKRALPKFYQMLAISAVKMKFSEAHSSECYNL